MAKSRSVSSRKVKRPSLGRKPKAASAKTIASQTRAVPVSGKKSRLKTPSKKSRNR